MPLAGANSCIRDLLWAHEPGGVITQKDRLVLQSRNVAVDRKAEPDVRTDEVLGHPNPADMKGSIGELRARVTLDR